MWSIRWIYRSITKRVCASLDVANAVSSRAFVGIKKRRDFNVGAYHQNTFILYYRGFVRMQSYTYNSSESVFVPLSNKLRYQLSANPWIFYPSFDFRKKIRNYLSECVEFIINTHNLIRKRKIRRIIHIVSNKIRNVVFLGRTRNSSFFA